MRADARPAAFDEEPFVPWLTRLTRSPLYWQVAIIASWSVLTDGWMPQWLRVVLGLGVVWGVDRIIHNRADVS